MVFDQLSGNWIYRSFVNRAELLPELDSSNIVVADVDKWSLYLFGQGVMVFHPTVTGGLRGAFHLGTAAAPLDMQLLGKIYTEGGETRLRWNAHGVATTDSDGWLYEYEGRLINKWPDGTGQTAAIVGSAIRSQNHDDLAPNQRLDQSARRGRVVSFIMVRVPFREAREVIPLPPALLSMLGSRYHRLHHCIWHGLRDHWKDSGYISEADKREITRSGWAPPRGNQLPTRGDATGREPDNGAGEDYLFMHRQMIREVTAKQASLGLPPIEAWKNPPEPDRDAENTAGFSVPSAWDRGVTDYNESEMKDLALIKSDEYWLSRMSFLDRRFKDLEYLSTLTLDQLGAKIEWLIHKPMQIRWSSQPFDPESGSPVPGGRPESDISDKWVRRETTSAGGNGVANKSVFYYDDLNDTFSSNAHPVFWRLLGWIDQRIGDWFSAHQTVHPGEVVAIIIRGVPWFAPGKWVAVAEPWIGPSPVYGARDQNEPEHDHDSGPGMAEVEVMERVHQIIFNPAVKAAKTPATSKISRNMMRVQSTV